MMDVLHKARYVSNAGLLFETEGQMLGIDVFSQDGTGLYPDTPPGIREELLEEIQAGRLNTLLFTHGHGDHFHREDVLAAWRRDPGLRVISTEAVVEELSRAGMPGERLQAVKAVPGMSALHGHTERGNALTGLAGEPVPVFWMSLGVFRVGFLNTLHEGAQYAHVQNLTLLIEAAGQRLVVSGDAAPSRKLFAEIAAWSRKIDWFFLPFPYVGLPSTRRMLEEELKIRHIFVLHQPRPEADTQNWAAHAKEICGRAKDKLPMPLFPQGLGEWYPLVDSGN